MIAKTLTTARLWLLRTAAFIRLGRFMFLAGGFAMYGLGLAIAYYSGAAINWRVALWGQILVTATQLMVHYSNDYYDFEADSNNQTPTAWSGGSRILQAGILPRRTAQIAAICLALVAVIGVLLLAIIEHPGPLAVPIVLLAVALSWAYSAPPMSLHARGVGEISGVLIVSVFTPMLGYYLQTGSLSLLLLLAILPLCCLQLNMLLSVDFPDLEGDAAVNKRTLVVRLGRATVARIYLLSLVSAYLMLPVLALIGLPPIVALCCGLNSPVALWIGWRTLKRDWENTEYWGRFAFFSIALVMSSTILELIAFVALVNSK
jgi:1,4-dihydroxy-2-naphthoate octaprenyltransferase